MAAGVTNRLFDVSDIVAMLEETKNKSGVGRRISAGVQALMGDPIADLLSDITDNQSSSLKHDLSFAILSLHVAAKNAIATRRLVLATWGLFAVGALQLVWQAVNANMFQRP